MELLSQGMKRVEVHDHHLRPLDQSIAVSEAFTLPSFQFSDACFSLDISKSIPSERNRNEAGIETQWTRCDSKQNSEKLQLLKRQSFSFGVKDLKREVTLAPSTGICTPVWDQLGRENGNRNAKAANDMKLFTGRATETETVNLRRPFWSKLLTCF
ncbi:uncharacterized protein LOC131000767 [Salvia miltiorrhiza]|uniref:uncharacterized protein LOC131000767 n=1 Tax=Salvia miltiorrhiza TaxID=226208 RepID=UPI0025AC8927|nr:uncharacterized protein LOC131000767 [Salvia miltiorrhiza]